MGQARPAIHALGDALERVEVDGQELWFDPSVPVRTTCRPEALLLPAFDEATLTYPQINFPRLDGHPFAGPSRSSTASGDLFSGAVLVDGVNVGIYSRTVGPTAVQVRIRFGSTVSDEQRERARIGAGAIGVFHRRPVELVEQLG